MSPENDLWGIRSPHQTQWVDRGIDATRVQVRVLSSNDPNVLKNITFHSPGDDERVSADYKLAKKAGYHGADCKELYHECPYGHGFMEKFSVLGYVTSKNFFSAFL